LSFLLIDTIVTLRHHGRRASIQGDNTMIGARWTGWLLAPALLLTFVAGACGEDGNTTTDNAKSTIQSAATKVTTAVTGAGTNVSGSVTAASSAKIEQKDLSFKPDQLSVKTGETVTFTNNDAALHTVVINGKNESGTMKTGDTFQWKSPSAGTYKVTCAFHPEMHAEITVN
jgi:plastocyanin